MGAANTKSCYLSHEQAVRDHKMNRSEISGSEISDSEAVVCPPLQLGNMDSDPASGRDISRDLGDWREELNTGLERNIYMLENGFRTDCTFVVGPEDSETEEFQAHQWILIRASAVFEAMFDSQINEALTGHVRITDIAPHTFHLLLRYAYTEDITFTTLDEAIDVAIAADKYGLKPLVQSSLAHMCTVLTPENIYTLLKTSMSVRYKELQQACLEVLKMHTTQCLVMKDFLQLSEEWVVLLLEQDELNVESEILLISAAVSWALCVAKKRGLSWDAAGVRTVLKPRVLPLLRLLVLTPEQFDQGPGLADWLTDEEKEQIIACRTSKDYSLLPNTICKKANPRKKLSALCNVESNWKFNIPITQPGSKVLMFNDGSTIVRLVISVNQNISLIGLVIRGQIKQADLPSNITYLGNCKCYQESMKVKVFKQSSNKNLVWPWSSIGSKRHRVTLLYSSKAVLCFDNAVKLEKNATHAIEVSLRRIGYYPYIEPDKVSTEFIRYEDVDIHFKGRSGADDYVKKDCYCTIIQSLIFAQ